jgi:hypothetical protein
MDFSVVKITSSNNCSIIAISKSNNIHRIDKVYRNDKHWEMFSIGKTVEIIDNKLYQNGTLLGNVENVDIDNEILEKVKTQITLEREINQKQSQLKHIDHLLLNDEEFIAKVYS